LSAPATGVEREQSRARERPLFWKRPTGEAHTAWQWPSESGSRLPRAIGGGSSTSGADAASFVALAVSTCRGFVNTNR